jgi:hypothetical protein
MHYHRRIISIVDQRMRFQAVDCSAVSMKSERLELKFLRSEQVSLIG